MEGEELEGSQLEVELEKELIKMDKEIQIEGGHCFAKIS